MLRNRTITSIIPVHSIDQTRSFYEDKLGLKSVRKLPSGEYILTAGEGSEIALREIEGVQPTGMTEITFEVPDIEKEITELESKGVKFEDYSDPEYKTDSHHVCTKDNMKAAWFKDPTGNVLCLHEYMEVN
jgi:catechol 2,3-dioxygenase-like lactoylglutathione lyase family enzyme